MLTAAPSHAQKARFKGGIKPTNRKEVERTTWHEMELTEAADE